VPIEGNYEQLLATLHQGLQLPSRLRAAVTSGDQTAAIADVHQLTGVSDEESHLEARLVLSAC
jgi:hypothetical protein